LYRAAHRALEHDEAGNLRAVRWNNDDRSVLRDVPYADIPRLYEAMRTWNQLISSQDSEYWVQLSPGTVICARFFSPPPSPLFSSGLVPLTGYPSIYFFYQLSQKWQVALLTLPCAAIDNHRVLHGRSAFTGMRRMCGAYIGVDEFRSRLAVLRERFASQASDKTAETAERSVWSPDF